MSYQQLRPNQFPPAVKNILIINVIFFVGSMLLNSKGIDASQLFGLHYFLSENYMPHQLITHMFMHGGLEHIFFNMFAVFMFGRILEVVWGWKKFLFFYLTTGLGAAFFQLVVYAIQIYSIKSQLSVEQYQIVLSQGLDALMEFKNFTNPEMAKLNLAINSTMVGASGAVFGLIMAYGMLFPNTRIVLLFPPIPMKAKYFAIFALIIGVLVDYGAAATKISSGPNVAHFAHLGGLVFGYLLLKYWQKSRKDFY